MGSRLPWAGLLLAACSSLVSVEDYDLLPPLPQLDFSRVNPGQAFQLWELRASSAAGQPVVIAAGGTAQRSDLDPALVAAFDQSRPQSGFGEGCLPGHCFRYFVTLGGTDIRLWNTADLTVAFLGPIDHAVEAALLASAHGYHWRDTRETAGVRQIPDGFELVVLRLVEACAPVRTDRFVLRVATSGNLQVLRSEIWEKDERSCI